MNAAELHLPAEMSPSAQVQAFVASEEGLRLAPYCCPSGYWTQGYGHTAGVTRDSPPITVEVAQRWLADDLDIAAEVVRRHVRVPLTQGQFDALTSFVFNIGPGAKGRKDGFAVLQSGKPSTLLSKLNQGQYEEAAAEFLKWTRGGGRVLPGLVKRRAAEMQMFERGT